MRTARALMAVAAAAAVIMLSSTAAMAIVFQVDTGVGWIDATKTCAEGGTVCVGTSGVGDFAGTSLVLNWDDTTTAQDSFLRIGALPDGGAFPQAHAVTSIDSSGAGQPVRVIQVQHENNVIPGEDNFLGTITVQTLVSLSEGGTTHDFPLNVDVTFIETDNQAGTCLPGSLSVCDDVFTFIDLNFTTQFVHDGVTYEITFTGLVNADGTAACTSTGPGQVECLTQENQTNNRFVDITLREIDTPVPAPASLLLLGLGLVGAGILRGRRAA